MFCNERGEAMWRNLLLVICFLTSFNLNAQIYTWVDEKGVTHFSNQAYLPKHNAKAVDVSPVNEMTATEVEYRASQLSAKKQSKKKNSTLKANAKKAKECSKWKNKLAAVKLKMKKGYTLKQAKGLKQKKRELSDKVWRLCR